MRDVVQRSFVVRFYFVKLQKAPSSIVKGILKHEWTVLPLGNMEAATPDVAVATTILF
jgi:hypothetical protein